MAHYRNSSGDELFDLGHYFGATLKFYCLNFCLFKETNSRIEGNFWSALVRSKWKISYDHRPRASSNHRAGKWNEFINGDGNGVLFAQEIVTSTVTNQKNRNSSLIENRSRHLFVAGEHRPLVTIAFKFGQVRNGYPRDGFSGAIGVVRIAERIRIRHIKTSSDRCHEFGPRRERKSSEVRSIREKKIRANSSRLRSNKPNCRRYFGELRVSPLLCQVRLSRGCSPHPLSRNDCDRVSR